MHSTILSIVSGRLEKCFRTLKRRHPSRTDIEPLMQAIKGNLNYERSIHSSMSELEQWTNTPHSTLTTSLRHTVQQLSQWASASSLQLTPPRYTHRQIYASVKILGAFRALRAIIDEVKAQTDAGNGAVALDIGVSIICAPTIENSALPVNWIGSLVSAPAPPRTRMNLREMLKVEFDNAASLVSSDPLAAETIVRLHRRVEAQLAAVASSGIPATQIDLPNGGMVGVETQDIPDLDKAMSDAAAAATIVGGDMGIDKRALQRSLDEHLDMTNVDLTGMGVGTGAEGDIDTDLGGLLDTDLGVMGIGMGDDDEEWGLDFNNM